MDIAQGILFAHEKDPLLQSLAAGKRRDCFRGLLFTRRGKTGDREYYRP